MKYSRHDRRGMDSFMRKAIEKKPGLRPMTIKIDYFEELETLTSIQREYLKEYLTRVKDTKTIERITKVLEKKVVEDGISEYNYEVETRYSDRRLARSQ
jgi:hypothetical protein